MQNPDVEQIIEFALCKFEEGSNPRALGRDANRAFRHVVRETLSEVANRPGLWTKVEAQCLFWMFKAGRLAAAMSDIAQEDEVSKATLVGSLEVLSERRTFFCTQLKTSLEQTERTSLLKEVA